MAELIDGKSLAAKTRAHAAQIASALGARQINPSLAVILVGDDGASDVYVKNKIRACKEVGIHSLEFRLSAETSQADLLEKINTLNADKNANGILVQFPLPAHINQARIIEAIDADKDVDGLHPLNAGRLSAGLPALTACTPQGCLLLARAASPSLAGKHVVIVGRSNLVGKPLAQLFLAADASVTIAHSKTRDLAALTKSADILVAAAGVPQLITAAHVREGAIVIDVGIHRVKKAGETKLIGDVAFDEVAECAAAITPVPGGVGPMTVACLMQNTLLASARQAGLDEKEIADLFARAQ